MGISLVAELRATAELCGTTLSETAAELLYEELRRYPEAQIRGALSRCRREIKGRLTVAEILSRLDDGRPGPEEAWGMIPKTEAETAVLTTEMLYASGAAQPLLDMGDRVAARMAFRERYIQLVADARAAGTPAQWQVSLGHDRAGRDGPIHQAVARGWLTAAQADRYLPGSTASHPQIPGPQRDTLDQPDGLDAINTTIQCLLAAASNGRGRGTR